MTKRQKQLNAGKVAGTVGSPQANTHTDMPINLNLAYYTRINSEMCCRLKWKTVKFLGKKNWRKYLGSRGILDWTVKAWSRRGKSDLIYFDPITNFAP